MPSLSPGERRRIVRRMFVHLGVCAAEAIHIERLVARGEVTLSPEARAVLDAGLAGGKGVVIVSGHVGNWELLGQMVANAGYRVTSIGKPLYDPRLTRLVHKLRTAYGMQILWRGDAGLTKEMMRVFKENGILGLLIDQRTRVQGAFVPFFGRPAHTPTAPASLALRTGAPLLVGWSHRHGHRHLVHFESLPVEGDADREEDVVALTARLNACLEAAVREIPEQWVWLHDRWKGIDERHDA